jgi:EF hand
MEIVSAIGAISTGLGVLSRLMPNRGNRPQSEFSQVLEQSMGRQVMQRLDIDASGTLTLNETKMPESVFRQLDANADGELTEAEINTGLESLRREGGVNQQIKSWMESHDSNHDGAVSRRESGLGGRAFRAGDLNGDLVLTNDELKPMIGSELE